MDDFVKLYGQYVNNKKYVFLLGGYDLEMIEIRKILATENDIIMYDKHLNWHNAHLSMYEEILQEYGNRDGIEIYGIELHETGIRDIPENYHRIDHHNDYSARPSSLEQVAIILNHEITREQQLIAANDKGYIPEMKKQGASDDEIKHIRLQDRKAQGVTPEDERKAEESVKNKTVEEGILVVKAATDRFSPVTDRLFPYEKLVIYTDDETVYYGKGKQQLTEYFDTEIKTGKMYHGGGNEGYIGTVKNIYSKEEIKQLKENIIQIIKNL
jgi:hypothetical protein